MTDTEQPAPPWYDVKAHYDSGTADAQAVSLHWSAKLRTAISLAESRLDADTFAHSMRVSALIGVGKDNTAGLKAMVVGVLHDLLEDQVRGQVVALWNLDVEFGEVALVFLLHIGDQRFLAATFLSCADHDRRAVRVIGTHVETPMSAQLLKPNPNIGLDILDQVAQMDRPIGVRQSRGH